MLGLTVVPVNAFWRMECAGQATFARVDPIMSPGKPSHHVHALHGSAGLSHTSTYEDLRKGQCTSCAVPEDMSAYWHPALYFKDDATGELTLVEEVGGMLAYYNLDASDIKAFPAGFRMIAGDMTRRNYSVNGLDVTKPDPEKSFWAQLGQTSQHDLEQRALGFNCLNYARDANEGTLTRHYLPNKSYLDGNCVDGIRLEVMFPSCWNGKDVDSPNHKDHMAYPDLVMTGNCPETHPVPTPGLLYEVILNVARFKDQKGTFVVANGDPLGYGVHGDFMSGWEPDFLQQAINTCTNLSGKIQDCPLFTIHSHEQQNQCKIPVPADLQNENTAKPGTSLPGNVPIEWGPNPAIPGRPPTPVEQNTQERPSATFEPGVEHKPGESFLPGQIFYATSTAWETASPVDPTPTAVVQAAAPDPQAAAPAPAVTETPAAAAPAPAVIETPAAAAPAPAVTEKPSVNNLRIETQTGNDGRVTVMVYQEEVVWVTEEVQVTTTIAAASKLKPRRSHRFRHLGRRANSRPRN